MFGRVSVLAVAVLTLVYNGIRVGLLHFAHFTQSILLQCTPKPVIVPTQWNRVTLVTLFPPMRMFRRMSSLALRIAHNTTHHCSR